MSAYCSVCRNTVSCHCWKHFPDGKLDTMLTLKSDGTWGKIHGPSETFAYKSALYKEQRQYEQELAEKAQAEKNNKP